MGQKKKRLISSQRTLTVTQTQPQSSIWTLNLVGYSKIAQQYYCELHRKRPQALLGSTDFCLPYEMANDGFLRVKREYFKKLEALVKERILRDPSYVNQLISSRQKKLDVLRRALSNEGMLLESGHLKNCSPLQTFSHLTDFACLYLEYNFPSSLFKELVVEKLKFSEDAYQDLRLRLLTPCESAYLTYYGAVLKLAQQKLRNSEIDLRVFRQQFASIGDRELKSRSDRELEDTIERICLMFGTQLSLRYEIMEIAAIEKKVRTEHAKIKQELLAKCWQQGTHVRNLVSSLSDMLIDAALENEQTSIWRGRVFAYLNCLIESLGLNSHTVSVEEIQSQISGLNVDKIRPS
jgi:hypothetical protein